MGKVPFQPDQSGRLPGSGGTGVKPIKISLGAGKKGVTVQ